jgi:1,4-dihydroxy-2-naphthoate octaprenyltransferase
LAVNNLRDLPKDSIVGKRTLAVRLGDLGARRFFIGLLILAHLAALLAAFISPWTLITLVFIPVTFGIIRGIRAGAKGSELIPTLGQVGKLQLLLSTSLAIALLV